MLRFLGFIWLAIFRLASLVVFAAAIFGLFNLTDNFQVEALATLILVVVGTLLWWLGGLWRNKKAGSPKEASSRKQHVQQKQPKRVFAFGEFAIGIAEFIDKHWKILGFGFSGILAFVMPIVGVPLCISVLAVIWVRKILQDQKATEKTTTKHLSTIDTGIGQFAVELRSSRPQRKNAHFEPSLHIEYADRDGVITERDICPIQYERLDRGILRVRAWCFLQNDTRTFRTDRMLSVRNLETGRRIQDLGRYLHREMPFLEA